MPPLDEQARAWDLDGAGAGPLVVRWNLHGGMDYEGARADYFPFDRLVDEGRGVTRIVGMGLAGDEAVAEGDRHRRHRPDQCKTPEEQDDAPPTTTG